MNDKRMRAAAGLFLLAASLIPAAAGHDDNWSPVGDVDGGVAGTFYGAAAYYVHFDGTTLNLPDPLGPLDPDFLDAGARMQCDLEVLGDGTSNQEPDETQVDGRATGVGTLIDGTFDDGGVGGACHTNHYDLNAYNTPGCVDDGARASNIAPFAAPWILAACDWKTVESSTNYYHLFGCLLATTVPCVLGTSRIHCSLNWDLSNYIDEVPVLEMCQWGMSHDVEFCGADFQPDGGNYGPGDTRVAYPHGPSTDWNTFTGDGLGCASGDATMAVFVFDGVTVTDGGAVSVNLAIQGDIWQVP